METDRSAAELITEGITEAGISIVVGLPESLLKGVYRTLGHESGFRYITVASESDMPSIAAGAYLGGQRSIMIMENSGIRQCCEPLARLALSHHLPMVMLLAFRGAFPEYNWWGHAHAQTMEPILNALRIPYWYVERRSDIKRRIKGAWIHADSSQWPVALILTGDCVEVPSYATV